MVAHEGLEGRCRDARWPLREGRGFELGEALDATAVDRRPRRPAGRGRPAELAKHQPKMPCFVQINVSGEGTKGGYPPGDVTASLEEARRSLNVVGLMTIAPLEGDPRPWFRQLRELAGGQGLPELSMGMTQDFEMAVEEGATCVRIGTAIFEGVLV